MNKEAKEYVPGAVAAGNGAAAAAGVAGAAPGMAAPGQQQYVMVSCSFFFFLIDLGLLIDYFGRKREAGLAARPCGNLAEC